MAAPHPRSSVARPRLRRNPRWLLAGVLAVVLGGLASAYAFQAISAADPVLRVNRTIHRGETIEQADLTVVALSRGTDVRTVPASRSAEVVGSAALTDVPAGSLLTNDSFGDRRLPDGQARVGVRLDAGRLPSATLVPGTPLLVVAVPAATGVEAEDLPASVAATLATAPEQQPDGTWVVDVTLATDRAEQVARLAALGRVALVGVG